MTRSRWLGSLLVFLVAASASAQSRDITVETMRSEKRFALVIGNGAYATSPLKNPVNDARAVAETLRSLGFDVIARDNASYKDMRRAVIEFGDQLHAGGVGVFYYAGHGIQVGGRNYLIPVDAAITSENEVEVESIDVATVLARMETAKNRLNVVVLDACRDNPFGRTFRTATRGLASVDAPTGTLIAYATAPGRVAGDGSGDHGPYTEQLVKAMREPGLKLEEVFKRVLGAVRRQTNGQQVPWYSSSVDGDFVFALGPQVTAIQAPPEPRRMEVREEVRQQLGSLAVSAKLEGIDVWIDDRRIGQTRVGRALIVNNVTEGSHRIKALKSGHADWEQDVHVAANKQTELLIDIEPLGPPKIAKIDDGAEMVLVSAGEFWMGNDVSAVQSTIEDCTKRMTRTGRLNPEATCKQWFAAETPRHRVDLKAFYIDRYEVTNALFETFVRATGHRTPAEREGYSWFWPTEGKREWSKVAGASWRAPGGTGTSASSDHPVLHVSWSDSAAYCKWAAKRLPTEAEWEKAARGSDERRYPWGNSWDRNRANVNRWPPAQTTPVGSYPSGVSPFGIHDMSGNVDEWVADWYDEGYYRRSPGRDPEGSSFFRSGARWRVARGGASFYWEFHATTTFRNYYEPDFRSHSLGFRCAKDAPK